MQIRLTEAKARLHELIRKSEHEEVVLLRHGRPAVVMISPKRLESLIDELEDLEDRLSAYESREIPKEQWIPLEKVKIELSLA